MILELNSTENHFEAVLENHNFAKLYYIVFSFLVVIFASPLYYGIIWYERFGHDNKRTLVNQLSSFFCMVIIAYILIVIPGDICTALMSKIHPCNCDFQNLLKNVSVVVLLLIFDSILVVKFVLIFYLKNPSIAHDDFWNLFVQIWITSFVFICQFVHFFFPGRKTLNYYICIRDFPTSDYSLTFRMRWFTIVLMLISIILCSVIYIKIKVFMKKGQTSSAENTTQLICHEMNMVRNKKSALILLMAILLLLLFVFGMRQMEPGIMNVFPHYYTYWLLHSIPQVFILLFLFLCYNGKGQLKKVLIRELSENLQKYDFTKDWMTVQA